MSTDENKQDHSARELFVAALDRPAGPMRDAWLAQVCGANATLLAQVGDLLANHLDDDFLAQPAVSAPLNNSAEPDASGQRVGPYLLFRRLGHGGMGDVYEAEQTEPIRRCVALKIIKPGMDTRSVIARFEAERQALAMMDHSNIAKVLDAGTTEAGRPYFVMELVRGIPITDYCEQNNFATRERLDLFIKVCQAVQHAHQKGIIHRDLKPSNILVMVQDGVAVPKVIDFGIAKALSEDGPAATVTHHGQFVGTPTYASPEQASLGAQDIDTRSDIYSLGVLLYELLTGTTPMDAGKLKTIGLDEIRRTIREFDPPKPSTRLTDELVANDARRRVPVKELSGDLDWITMKALEKDRTRRYETATAFAQDLQRHLNNEPVLAGAPSQVYRLRKLIRRNKAAFAAAAAVFLALLAGLSLAAWQATRANRALDELRASAPAFAEQARTLAAKGLFDEAVEKLTYASNLRPDSPEYFVQRGNLLQCQFRFADAAAAYRRALQLHPGNARVQASAALCDELIAAPRSPEGKLTRESLSKLHLAMQRQQRPAAEMLPVARLLGEEKKLLVNYWSERLKDLPFAPGNPIEKRLVVQEDGLLSLDLCGTQVVDLGPLANMPLSSLDLCDCEELTDIRPLRQIPSLTKLDLTSTKVSDLSPLQGLKLQELNLSGTIVHDIAPLRGLPLVKLSLASSSVTDLSPLVGMPLTEVNLSATPVVDFSPLSGLPLERCYLRRCRLSDLSVLRGLPLKELVLWGCSQAHNYSALSEIPSLEYLFLPDETRALSFNERAAIGQLRNLPKLQRIGTDVMGGRGYAELGSADVFWQEWDRDARLLDKLNQGNYISYLGKLPNGTYRLVCKRNVFELSFLRDSPVTELAVNGNGVFDLNPLRNLRLTLLNIYETSVSDLSPLRGMPMEYLYMGSTKVSDLSPLKGMPLRTIYLAGCKLATNVSALAEIQTLEQVSLPIEAQQVESLRKLPKLERIGYGEIGTGPGIIAPPVCTAETFWRTWDGMKWARALEEAGMRFSANQRPDGFFNVSVRSSRFTNCSIFKGASIRELDLSETPAIDYQPLLECTNLERLILPAGACDAGTLRRLNSFTKLAIRTSDGSIKEQSADELLAAWKDLECAVALNAAGIRYRAEQSPDGFWKITVQTPEFSDCSVFRGSRISRLHLSGTQVSDLAPLEGMPLKELFLYGTSVSNLAPLKGMPLQQLGIIDTRVTDLSPLRGLPLTLLHFLGTPATNFSPLASLPLTHLQLNAHVGDISFLRDMPLRELQMGPCTKIKDYSPLARCRTLERLLLPPNATGIEFLRQSPKLKRISFKWDLIVHRPAQTAEEFWTEYDPTAAR